MVVGAIVLVAGAVSLALAGHAHYAIQHWLFWRLVGYWAVCSFFAFACLSSGSWFLRLLGLTEMSFLDRVAVAFASGVVLFFLGMFAAGIAGVMTPGFVVLWPCVLAALDGRGALRVLWRLFAALFRRPHLGWGELAATCFGLAGLGMVYFTILTPDNLGFDARWYHLPIAEHFAAGRAIGRFEEGWFLGAYPHLASVIYAWAFLLPKTDLFDRVLLASHLELTFFVATLACVGLMVRHLVRPAPRGTWAAVFLFPSVFLYDGGLFGAADHVLAFFAIPAYLCLDHAMKRPSVRRCASLAIVLSGALLTKYQAVLFFLPIAAALGLTIVLRWLRGFSRGLELGGPAVAVIIGLLVTAPHWLANWIWYSDPLFPLLHDYLPSRPLTSQALGRLDVFLGTDLWRPHGGLWKKMSDTGRALVTFSLEPHDWATYHGSVPIFGSLFTIASFLALVLRRVRRIWQGFGMTLGGIALWYLTSHQDRYLQCLLPWMAAITVATAVEAWRQFPPLRPWMALPVAMQIVWGGDVYFMPANDDSYEVDRPSPIKSAVDLISSGYRGDDEARRPFKEWESVGSLLPRGAKVLLHERYLHLGIGAMTVSDLPGWQGGISYEERRSPREIFELFSKMGVTHILWETGVSHEQDSVPADVAFFQFVTRFAVDPHRIDKFTIAKMPSEAPPPSAPPTIAWHDCMDPRAAPPPDDADAIMASRGCEDACVTDGRIRAAVRGANEIWVPFSSQRPRSRN